MKEKKLHKMLTKYTNLLIENLSPSPLVGEGGALER
jgi:hypothetical protein